MTFSALPPNAVEELLAGPAPRIGAFRIVKKLGAGGFAPVMLAVEEHDGRELRTVALKVFELEDAGQRARIIDEAHALCRVEHPAVVRFFQLVEEGPLLALAMELVRGTPVSTSIDQRGSLDLRTTLDIGVAVASALAAVHAAGLIHRDVKPDNVIEHDGRFTLIDFGIARAHARTTSEPRRGDEDEDEDDDDALAGTMGYIDPECAGAGRSPDASSDLYALGAMLYECLSGLLPASSGPGMNITNLRLDVACGESPAPPLRQLAPTVPEDVAALVDALVAPLREQRPRRAEWVACELERLRRTVRTGRSRPLPPGGPFRGLSAFVEADRDLLVGRSIELASALEMLRIRGVVTLVGASGSGKTSLARAGLLPAIVDGELGRWPPAWRAVVLSPGPDARATCAHVLGTPEPRAGVLAKRVEEEGVGLVLYVDALEELVTVSRPDTRAPLLRLLEEMHAEPRPGLRAVVSVRRDLLDPLLALGPIGQVLTRSALLVSSLSAASLADSLDERLAAHGYRLEDAELRAQLGQELAATAEAMPLVEFALSRLWNERDDRRHIIPRAALARIGGIAGALERHAETVLGSLGPHLLEAAQRTLLELTTPRGTRTKQTAEALVARIPQASAVLTAFESARLVVRDEGTFTLAHEALLSQWTRLREWARLARADRELAEEVARLAARWIATNEPDLLLRGRLLEDARRIDPRLLAPDALDFVAASRRAQLRSRVGLGVLTGSVVFAAAFFAVMYLVVERDAEREKRNARDFATMLASGSNVTNEERVREVRRLHMEKHACEKALARCSGDAGAH